MQAPAEPTGGSRRGGVDLLSGLVLRYLDEQHTALRAGERALLAGRLDEVHATRIAARRYRTVLRVFPDLFEESALLVMDQNLRWYGALLGNVHEIDALEEHLRGGVVRVGESVGEAKVGRRLDAAVEGYLSGRRTAAVEKLLQGTTKRRFASTSAQLRTWHEEPPLAEAVHERAFTVGSRLSAAEHEADVVVRAQVHPGAAADDLRPARKAARRARYIAELAEPVLEARARRTIRRMTLAQDRLGVVLETALGAEAWAAIAHQSVLKADDRAVVARLRDQDHRASQEALRGFAEQLAALPFGLASTPDLDALREQWLQAERAYRKAVRRVAVADQPETDRRADAVELATARASADRLRNRYLRATLR